MLMLLSGLSVAEVIDTMSRDQTGMLPRGKRLQEKHGRYKPSLAYAAPWD